MTKLRSYQETVVVPMRQMNENNQQLVWLKNKVTKEQKHSKALQEYGDEETSEKLGDQEEDRIGQGQIFVINRTR